MSVGKNAKILLCSVVGLLLIPSIVLAESAISQGFMTKESLVPGTIVSGTAGSQEIEQASPDNTQKLIGVVSETSLVELSDSSSQVQVATSGVVETFVSDINGDVKVGDRVTASPLKGVGMKATETGYVVGTAREDFAAARNMVERSITDKSGQQKTVRVGLLSVQINVIRYEKVDNNKSVLPQFILNLARAIAGPDVSIVRILIALFVLVAGLVSISVLLYASVRSSISSIGRNPLAAAAVNRGLVEVSLLALGIMLIMIAAVYLILVI